MGQINKHKKSFFLSLFTLFIFNIHNSKKRRNKLEGKKHLFENRLVEIRSGIIRHSNDIRTIKKAIVNEKDNTEQKIKLITEKIDEIKKNYETQISQVQPLDCTYQEDKDFVSLKNFIGMDNGKIIGCYIIHNTEITSIISANQKM
jgi:hypothetical protein